MNKQDSREIIWESVIMEVVKNIRLKWTGRIWKLEELLGQ